VGTGARATTLRRTVDIAGTAVCTGVLLMSVFVVLAASARGRDGVAGSTPHVVMLEPGTASDTGLRDLPVLRPDGPVATAFPGGAGLADRARVRTVARSLAGPLGLGPVIGYLLRTKAEPIDVEHQLDLYHGYPYTYPQLDPVVDGWLDADAVRRDPGQVVELASLLLLSAVEDPAEDDYGDTNSHAAVAYSVLRRAREVTESCDLQLELMTTLAMGYAPHVRDVATELAETRRLCPDDPTPLWLMGQVQITEATRIPSAAVSYLPGSRGMEAGAEKTFATLRRDFPDSPLGWAGAADLRLKQADEGDELGVQRFENRQRRREALALYEQARARSDDPALLAGYGWALSGLGRHDEAVAALTRVHELFPDDPAYRSLLVLALQRAGRPADVVSVLQPLLATDPPARTSLRLTPQTVEVREPELTAYGARDSVAGGAYDASQQYSAGAVVADTGFIPASNTSWTDRWCPVAALVGAQVQLGDGRAAYDVVRSKQQVPPQRCPEYPKVLVDRLGGIAAFSTGDEGLMRDAVSRRDAYGGAEAARDEIWDDTQDFWRSVGDWDRASETIDRWRADLPGDPWPDHRAGEVAYLRDDADAAVSAYSAAADEFRASAPDDWGEHGYGEQFVGVAEGAADNALELGAALQRAGRLADAREAYTQAVTQADGQELTTAYEVDFFAHSQLGALAIAVGDYQEAARDLALSLEKYRGDATYVPGDDIFPSKDLGAQDNNLALALAKLGRDDDALTHAQSALAHDLANPVYVDTLAFVQQLAGDDAAATATYRKVLETDPTSYVSANNLAVLLAQHGHRAEAEDLLERAVAVAPRYAIGWHNLGVVREPASHSLLASQGALARAARLDRGLRGEDGLVVDEEIYQSGLDVSRPLSPDWQYAASATSTPRTLTLGVLALLFLRLLWTLGLDKLTGTVSEKLLTAGGRGWRLPSIVAVVASAGVLGWPVVSAAHSSLERVVLVGAVAAMVVLPLFVRRLVARDRTVAHFAWVPAVGVGVVGVPFGVAFAPYPTLVAPASETRLRWAVPAAVVPVALVFVALAAVDPVPLARVLALTATALLSSVLTPVPPLDGAYLKHRLLSLGVTVVFTGTTLAFAFKWI
jgi:tetratricopeptide (TPR) repeat protein